MSSVWAFLGEGTTCDHPVVATNTFYFIEAWHDANNDEIGIRVSDALSLADAAVQSFAGGVHEAGADLNVGAHNTCRSAHLQGTIDALGFWPRVLSDVEREFLLTGWEPPVP